MTQVSTSPAILLTITMALASFGTTKAETTGLSPDQQADLPRHFGFAPLEIIKLDNGITQLRLADFNNDGASDMVIANNKKSTVEVLIQQKEKSSGASANLEVNELAEHWRFDRVKVSVTYEIISLQAGDVNGDSNADIVFFGKPNELIVLPGRGDGTFKDAITRRVPNGVSLPASLELADMNNDGLTDALVLTKDDVLVFQQQSSGTFDNPKRFPHGLENPLGVTTADIDGNDRPDLILATGEEGYPVRIRLQRSDGQLGAFERVRLPALRSLEFADTYFRRGEDLFGVERVSGRLRRWHMDRENSDDTDRQWAVLQIPIPGQSGGNAMPLALGDLNGDNRHDVITADTEAAQFVLQLQQADRGLAAADLFGGQVDMRDIRCFDSDGDGTDEVYVCSPEERSIAKSTYTGKRLTFPKAIKTYEKPFALDIARPKRNADPALAYVSRDGDSIYWLTIQPLAAESVDDSIAQIELEDMDEPPAAVRWIDANRDGRHDVLIFSPDAPLVVALQTPDGSFELIGNDGDAQTGLVNDARIQAFAHADADGDGQPEILLAQKSFIRALHINDDNAWEILDQYNAPTSDARLTGLCNLTDDTKPALAAYDRSAKEVLLFKADDSGSYELDRKVQVGALSLKAMHATPLGGTDAPTILLASPSGLTLVVSDRSAIRAMEKGAYESSLKNARLGRIAVGDLNHDRVPDIAVIDNANHFIEVLTFAPDESLVRANKFRVFAKKQFRRRGQNTPEPRWIEIHDVTNDGHDDLILIAHDRILIYPGQ